MLTKNNIFLFLVSLASVFLIALSARISIQLPGLAVPQSAQTFAIMLIAFLPRFYGVLAISLYLIAGAIGLPVFADGAGGYLHFIGNSGGYLVGFWFAVFGIFLYKRKSNPLRFVQIVLAMCIAHLIVLTLGWTWLSRLIGVESAYSNGVQPFLLGGLIKSLAAALIVHFMHKYLTNNQ